jgi:hypothetical protein
VAQWREELVDHRLLLVGPLRHRFRLPTVTGPADQ